MTKYAVAVTGDMPKQVTFLRNTEKMPDQIMSVDSPDFMKYATFDTPAAAAKQIAMFAVQYDTLAKRWGFEIVRVVPRTGITTESLK